MTQAKVDSIKATLGIFSGRPNPVLELAGSSADQLAGLVKSTIGAEPIHPPPAPKLGEFYGFQVRVAADQATRLGLPADFTVYRSVLSEGAGRDQRHWRDVGKVEQFLIERAFEQGLGDFLELVGIKRGP
jgi:hypothetical protein